MREIKFRGRKINTTEWITGNLSHIKEDRGTCGLIVNNHALHIVDLESVGQYTGLKDRNGQEVYEGHIIEAHTFDANIKEKLVGKVEYSNERHGFVFIPTSWEFKNLWYPLHAIITCDIIGNSYENPEIISN